MPGQGRPPGDGTDATNPAFWYDVVHFDQIPAYVRDGKADAGLIIHEGQLTFANDGAAPGR